VDPTAVVSPTARLGGDVRIGPLVVVGDGAVIGDRVELHPHVTIYPGVRVGDDTVIHAGCVLRENTAVGARCILQPNVVLGGDGFGFARRPDGAYEKIEQMGTVLVHDDVEIGAGTTVDRATFAETRIGRGTKIDNLVQIGHNSAVGEDTILCAQVGLAGSTTIGRGVTLAGQVGVAGHLEVGDGAIATAQTGIPSSVAPRSVVSGYPAMDNRGWLKSSAVFTRLPDLHRLVRRLEARVAELEARQAAPAGEDGRR
jgi:UDP-3-O-[3-hydroxymyristoyl] glucosamine N-acyltransferase